jgi:hypothetical protein
LIVIPDLDAQKEVLTIKPVPSTELKRRVKSFLEPRKLVGTGLRIDAPIYKAFDLFLKVAYKQDYLEVRNLSQKMVAQLRKSVHPIYGGDQGSGWPFGLPVTKEFFIRMIEGIDGVNHVEDLVLVEKQTGAKVERIVLAEGELPFLEEVEIEERKMNY